MKHFSLKPLKFKIVITFISGCLVLISAYTISEWVFRETFDTLEAVNSPNPKLILIERLFPEVNRLDKTQRMEALKSPIRSIKNFQGASRTVLEILDSLQILYAGDTLEDARISKMRKLISERNEIFLNYLDVYNRLIKSKSISKELKEVTENLSIALNSQDTGLVRSTTKSVTTTSVVEIPQKTSAVKKEHFLKRLFSKRKTPPVKIKPIERKIITQNVEIRVDTFKPVRNIEILPDLDKAIQSIEAKHRIQGSKLLQQEIKLSQANAHFIDQLQSLLQEVQNEEISQLRSKTNSLEIVFSDAFHRIGIIAIVFIGLTLLLIALMFFDIAQSNRYKTQLVREKEKAQYLEQVKQRFLSNMSHELRTPLQAILSFSEQVKKQQVPEKKALDAISTSSAYLLQLVNEVLDYQRIVSDKFTINKEEFDLSELLGEIADVVEAQCEKKGIKFVFRCNLHQHQVLFGDAFRLKQILYNILGNAVKFTESGVVSLYSTSITHNEKSRVTFEVCDTGIGISESEIKHIFNSFEQANFQVQKKYGGSGLGLSIVKELVALHDGQLSVQSDEGKGTCFKVTLLYDILKKNKPGPDQLTRNDLAKRCQHVLIIDDDPFVLQLCGTILERHDVKYTCFNASADLIEKEWNYSADLVLMDMRMPDLDSKTLFYRMKRKMSPDVSFVAMTSYTFIEERENIASWGFDQILLKPFSEEDLVELVTAKKYHVSNSGQAIPQRSIDTILKMSNNDPTLAQKTLRVFSEQILLDLEDLKISSACSDLSKISMTCHRLSSKMAQIGLNSSAQRLLFIEREIRDNNRCTLTEKECERFKQLAVNLLNNVKVIDTI